MEDIKFSTGDKVVCSDEFNRGYYGDHTATVLGYVAPKREGELRIIAIDFGEKIKGAWDLLPPFVLPNKTGTYCYEKDLKLVSNANDWSVDLI